MNRDLPHSLRRRVAATSELVGQLRCDGLYSYGLPISEQSCGPRVVIRGRETIVLASYNYMGLLGHPRINAAAVKAVERFGTGTHGVRVLAGTLTIHEELEETIARCRGAEAAITFSSGYLTNITVISTLLGRDDYVFSDKLNHASIVDGCNLAAANHVRFTHNDMESLARRLEAAPQSATKLVVADAVFSMDGDVFDLPRAAALCREHGALLMLDEAHSHGVLGATGGGIEEHFDMKGSVDIKMGTLSKAIPAVGGYIASTREIIEHVRHRGRAFVMSAPLPPPQAAAAMEAIQIMQDEPQRAAKLEENARLFRELLKARGFDTLRSETPIVPILCGPDEKAFAVAAKVFERGILVSPIVTPVVPRELGRVRATVTASHEREEIENAVAVLEQTAREVGIPPFGA